MPNPASTTDLEARWRPLSAQEETNGTTFLEDAWRMLRRQVTDLEARIADDSTGDLEAEAVRVMATAVLRLMKNPDGKRQEAIDDYLWIRDESVSSGLLYFTDDELAALSSEPEERGPAFSFSLLPADYPDSRFED